MPPLPVKAYCTAPRHAAPAVRSVSLRHRGSHPQGYFPAGEISGATDWMYLGPRAADGSGGFPAGVREFAAPWRRRTVKHSRLAHHGRKGDDAVIERLTPAQVRAVQDPAELPCRMSDEMPPLEGIIGQDRAMRALSFGLGIQQAGYHIYVSGIPGTGKTTAVLSYLEEVARTRP